MKNSSRSPVPIVLTFRAPAKINWFLKIKEKRSDGYHTIESLMQCVTLYDTLHFEHTTDAVELNCDQNIPVADNLVHKAACLLREYTACKKGAHITIEKNIPIGAGLGGGSSDAACALIGLNTLWGLNLPSDTLCALGARIGSDVTFFLNGACSVVEGRGERTTPVSFDQSVALLLVKPPFSVSTTWAYDSFDRWMTSERDTKAFANEKLKKKPLDIKLFCQALSKKDFATLTEIQENDLEHVIIARYPIVKEIKERLLDAGAAISAMSGSGSTVFGIFESKDMAEKAAAGLGPNWCRVVETLI